VIPGWRFSAWCSPVCQVTWPCRIFLCGNGARRSIIYSFRKLTGNRLLSAELLPGKPVILSATERSGSNLLRAILSSHSQIASPPPAGLIPAIAPHFYRYTNSSGGLRSKSLIQDAISLIRLHWSPWDVELDPEEISSRMQADTFWALFRALNESYAQQKACPIWLSKEPQSIRWVLEISESMPDAKFILLVRDGRDVALSMLKSQFPDFHVYSAALTWSQEQRAGRKVLHDPNFKGRAMCIRYEKLLENPSSTVSELSDFIGVQFESQMLEYYKDVKNITYSKKTTLWKNIREPIISDNIEKYKAGLSKRQIRIFEAVAWDELRSFGYATEFTSRPALSSMGRLILKMWSRLLRKFKIRLSSDYERQKRWREQLKTIANFPTSGSGR